VSCAGAVLGLLITLLGGSAAASSPRVDYALHCMGCHLDDGRETPGRVPALTGMGRYLSVPEGRAFLVRVPGSAQAPIDDAALAALLNWMLQEFSPADLPPGFVPYEAVEVGALRRQPLVDVSAQRQRLLAGVEARP
jgi:hypothetical protein